MSMVDECQLERTCAGVYEREVGRGWLAQGSVHGGYVLALAISAVETEFAGSEMMLQQLTLHYLRPIVDGRLRVEVTVERQGRRMANVSVRLFSAERLSGLGVASVAQRRKTGEVALVDAPLVKPYDPNENSAHTRALTPIHERLWIQPRIKDGDGHRVSRVGGWVAPRTAEPIDHRWVAVLVDLWAPAVYRAWTPRHTVTTVDLTYHLRHELPDQDVPAGSPLLVVLTNRVSAGGFVDEDVEVWTCTGVLLAQSRQMRFVNDIG
ncbi:thioesterase family protein [Mycobacterium stomatepiae]|nr:thioesterase family protein [Mycobacterium stomatepiae]